MSYLAYILASLIALIYAIIAWKLYPHFISIKDQFVKSKFQLYWGRFAASWLLFAIVVITIPRNWSKFDAGVHSFVGGNRHSNIELGPSPTEEASPASVAVSKPVEQIADAPASRPLEDSSSSETSHPPTQQVGSSEGVPQQPDETSSKSSAPGMLTSASSGTFAPSFDCTKASTGPERLICSNQQLASLDVQLMQAYRRARRSASNKDSLRAAQIDWIKNQRDACSTAECMISAYKTRIQSIEAITP
jgi:uncharacterized protein YecT (DUF1311 family)